MQVLCNMKWYKIKYLFWKAFHFHSSFGICKNSVNLGICCVVLVYCSLAAWSTHTQWDVWNQGWFSVCSVCISQHWLTVYHWKIVVPVRLYTLCSVNSCFQSFDHCKWLIPINATWYITHGSFAWNICRLYHSVNAVMFFDIFWINFLELCCWSTLAWYVTCVPKRKL